MISRFHFPSPVLLEPRGYRRFISDSTARFQHLLVMTGQKSMKDIGVLDELEAIATEAKVQLTLYSRVRTNPTNADADAACAFRASCNADAVMAVGGGSCLDLAKIVAMQATNGGSAWDYINLTGRPAKPIVSAALPIIAVPTTAGTGSEATPYAVITHETTRMKKGMGSPKLYPSLVILDPHLLTFLPARMTAVSAFDAFGQALESYTSARSTLHSSEFSWLALRNIVSSFDRCLAEPGDLDARARMAWGAFLSGLGIGITDVNLAHALSHPLSGRHGIDHGLAVFLCTFQGIRFNRDAARERYAEAARLFGAEAGTEDALVDALIERLLSWARASGVNLSLESHGVREADLEILANDAMEIGAIRTNIRPVSRNDVLEIYRRIWAGRTD